MKTYHFEYANEQRVKASILIGFAMLFAAGTAAVILDKTEQEIFLFVLIAFFIAGIFFYLNTRKVKQKGSAQLHDDSVVLNIFGKEKNIRFIEIDSFLDGGELNGTYIKFTFKDGKKFTIASNPNFCEVDKFKVFMDDTIKQINTFNQNHPDTAQVRPISHPFASNWMLYTAWFCARLLILILIPLVITGNFIKLGVWLIFAIVTYTFLQLVYNARKKEKN